MRLNSKRNCKGDLLLLSVKSTLMFNNQCVSQGVFSTDDFLSSCILKEHLKNENNFLQFNNKNLTFVKTVFLCYEKDSPFAYEIYVATIIMNGNWSTFISRWHHLLCHQVSLDYPSHAYFNQLEITDKEA